MKIPIDFSKIELTYIVPVYLGNRKSDALDRLVSTYNSYSNDILSHVHFIFIDDASPIQILIETNTLQYSHLRIETDISWNQGGARNLGVMQAKSAKIILTDLDHVFPEQTFKHLLESEIPSNIYQFARKNEGKEIRPHAGTYFTSKSTYYKSLGFDEEFCGNYGNDDIYFLRLQRRLGTKVKLKKRNHIDVIEHTQDDQESHHGLHRDTKVNYDLLLKKSKFFKTRNPLKGHSRKHLEFEWKVIE